MTENNRDSFQSFRPGCTWAKLKCYKGLRDPRTGRYCFLCVLHHSLVDFMVSCSPSPWFPLFAHSFYTSCTSTYTWLWHWSYKDLSEDKPCLTFKIIMGLRSLKFRNELRSLTWTSKKTKEWFVFVKWIESHGLLVRRKKKKEFTVWLYNCTPDGSLCPCFLQD